MYTQNMNTEQMKAVPEDIWRIHTNTCMDALNRARDSMVTGEIRAICYTVQSTIASHHASCGFEYYDCTDITDYGDVVQFDTCNLMFRVDDTDHHLNDDGIELRWYLHGTNVASIQVFINEYAATGSVFDYLENIQIQWMDGTWRNLLDWYESVCSREIYTDITDNESFDVDGYFDELNDIVNNGPFKD